MNTRQRPKRRGRLRRFARRLAFGFTGTVVLTAIAVAYTWFSQPPMADHLAPTREAFVREYGEMQNPEEAREAIQRLREITYARYSIPEDATSLSELTPVMDDQWDPSLIHSAGGEVEWSGHTSTPKSAPHETLLTRKAIALGFHTAAMQIETFDGVSPDGLASALKTDWGDLDGGWHPQLAATILRNGFILACLDDDADLAFETIAGAYTLGVFTAREPSVIDQLLAKITIDRALRPLRESIRLNTLPAGVEERLLSQIQPTPIPNLQLAMTAYRGSNLNLIEKMYHGLDATNQDSPFMEPHMVAFLRLKSPYKKTMAQISRASDRVEAVLDLPVHERRLAGIHPDADYSGWFTTLGLKGMRGVVQAMAHFAESITHSHAELQATRTMLAIELHRERNAGTPPATLDDIANLLGGEVPLDPESGTPFIYHADAAAAGFTGVSALPYILISAGPDGDFDGNPTDAKITPDDNDLDRLWTAPVELDTEDSEP